MFDPFRYFSMIAARDIAGLGDCFTTDASFEFGGVSLRGRDLIVSGYAEFLSSMAAFRIEATRIWRPDPAVKIVEGVAHGRNAGDPVEFAVPMVSIFDLQGERIRRQRDYFDPGAMLPRTTSSNG